MHKTNLLLITSGGTIAGNVAKDNDATLDNQHSANFAKIIEPTIEAMRRNWP